MHTGSSVSVARSRVIWTRLFRLLGIDRAVFFAILARIWGPLAGIVSMLLITTWFSPETQGYYYTFSSIVALQIFAELGLSVVMVQFASHEWAKLGLDERGQVIGDPHALSRLISIASFALKWYVTAAAVVVIGLGIGGYVFLAQNPAPGVSWEHPWFALCVVTGLNLCLLPFMALLEGCNQISSVYYFRFVQALLTNVGIWAGIASGADLWTPVIGGIVGLTVGGAMLAQHHGPLMRVLFLSQPRGERIQWRKDLLPMQWRIAASWVSGYFFFSLFTPMVFHYHGAVVAGQMGMSLSLAGAITSIASAWNAPKGPQFGILIAQRRYSELDRLFWRVTATMVGIMVAGAAVIWTADYVLNAFRHPLAARFLPPVSVACLLAANVVIAATYPMSTYLRAHRKEPLLLLSVVNAPLSGATIWLLAKYGSVQSVAIGFLVLSCIMAPWVALVWYRRRAEWHSAPPGIR